MGQVNVGIVCSKRDHRNSYEERDTQIGLAVTFLPTHNISLTFRHRASYILGQAFHYSPENAFYIFNQHIYFII